MVSVVIPVRNGGASFEAQLAALAAQDHEGPWELIVSDNGSTDDTRRRLADWAERLPQMRVVDGSARPGASAARMDGVAASHPLATRLLFCDADDLVSPSWVRGLSDALEAWPIATGPMVLVDADGVERARSTTVPRYYDLYGYALGASLGIRRDVLDDLGGFVVAPPGISSGDAELGWRAHAAGYQVGWAPDAVVVKRRRPDLRGTWHQWYGYGRGARWIARRHRAAGVAAARRRTQLRTLAWLVTHPIQLGGPEGRRRWVCWAAQACGYARSP